MRTTLLDRGGRGVSVVGRDHHQSFARVLEQGHAGVSRAGGDVARDADGAAVGERDASRPAGGPGGGFAQCAAHRIVDREDRIGRRRAYHAIRLQICTVPGHEDHGNGCQQGDHQDGGRPHPPLQAPVHAHPWSTAALSARRLPFARNGTPSFAAWALSSTLW